MRRALLIAALSPLAAMASVPVSSAPFVGGPASHAAELARDGFDRMSGESPLVNLELANVRHYYPVPVNEWSVAGGAEFARLDPGVDSRAYSITPGYDYNRFRGVSFSALLPVSFGTVDGGGANADYTRAGVILGAAFHPLVGKLYGTWDWSIAPSAHFGFSDDDRYPSNGYIAGGALTNRVAYNFWLCTLGFSTQIFDSQNLTQDSIGNHSMLLTNEADLSVPFLDHWVFVGRGGNEYGLAAISTRTVWHYGVGLTYRNSPPKTTLTDWFPSQVDLRFDRRDAPGDYAANEVTLRLTWNY